MFLSSGFFSRFFLCLWFSVVWMGHAYLQLFWYLFYLVFSDIPGSGFGAYHSFGEILSRYYFIYFFRSSSFFHFRYSHYMDVQSFVLVSQFWDILFGLAPQPFFFLWISAWEVSNDISSSSMIPHLYPIYWWAQRHFSFLLQCILISNISFWFFHSRVSLGLHYFSVFPCFLLSYWSP